MPSCAAPCFRPERESFPWSALREILHRLACGTGCCATAVACVLNGLTDEEITVKLLGGELHIKWDRKENLVYMTGPAKIVFEGEVDPYSI